MRRCLASWGWDARSVRQAVDDERALVPQDHALPARLLDLRVGVLQRGGLGCKLLVLLLKRLKLGVRVVGSAPGVEEVHHRADVGEDDREKPQPQHDPSEPIPVDPRRPATTWAAGGYAVRASAHAPWFGGGGVLPSGERLDPRIDGALPELLLNPQQLVVLRHAIGARG